jgi:single-strand DNA-binding protein
VNYNKVFLGGNLTRDPEFKTLESGAKVCNFSIAVNRRWKDKSSDELKEEVAFIGCVAWQGTATVISEHFKKGDPIFVEGRIKTESYEKDGVKQSRTKVVVESVQFIFGKKADGDTNNSAEEY